jgi:hypothetical protein
VIREDFGAIDRLLLIAAIDSGDFANPWPSQTLAHSLQSALRKRPMRNRDVTAYEDVWMSDEVHIFRHSSPAFS